MRRLVCVLQSLKWTVGFGALALGCVPDRPASDANAGASEREELDVAAPAPSAATPPAAAAERAAAAPNVAPAPSRVPLALSKELAPESPTVESGPRLDRARLIREVLARNPELAARRAAWRAARNRSRQVALEDPMLSYEIAPLSIFSGMRLGQTVRLSQRFPWPGKLSYSSEAEEQAAAASGREVNVTELDLALETSLRYDEYWLIDRSLEVNVEHRRLLGEMRRAAQIQYGVGRASLSDPLQADVEIAMLTEQDLGLASQRDIVIAELNALLHREPSSPLPPPPVDAAVILNPPVSKVELERQALAASPELGKLAAQARSAQARVRVAERQYYPDVTLMASYSSMFAEPEHQFMVGFEIPLPIQRGSRGGTRDEASALAAEINYESTAVADRIRAQVQSDRRRVIEAIEIVKIYDSQIIPTARSQVVAARVDFSTGKIDFSSVISAEKNLRNIQLSRHQAVAELSKRRASLDRSLGRMPFDIQKAGVR